jgi:hypothetical protein
MPATRIHRLARLVQGYYWLTPVFLFLSWRFGFDVRVPFLDAVPGARAAYYALTFGCAALVTVRPELTAIVGRTETTLSMSLLIISTWLAYISVLESAASDAGTLHNPFTPDAVTSLVLSATVFIVSSLIGGAEEPRTA